MARTLQVRYQFIGGESEHQFNNAGKISPRSYNFLPDKRGFLRTYRGKKSIFAPSLPGELASKWVTAGAKFVDVHGRDRNVVVAGRSIYAVDGKDFTLLFTYPTDIGLDAGTAHVKILEHRNHVIFLHPGHPPLKWNGDEPVNWVGVREVPASPEVHTFPVFDQGQVWGGGTAKTVAIWGAQDLGATGGDHYYPVPFLQSDMEVDGADIDSLYFWKVAYQNSNGALGRWSSPVRWKVGPTVGADNNTKAATRLFPIIEWDRPKDKGPTETGTDITHVWVARTSNAIADPDAAAFFLQGIYPYTQNRITDNKAGLSLAVDEDNFPPEKAGLGCIWRDFVFLSGNRADPYGVWYSKSGYWETFPPLNYYKATDVVTAVLPLSDRVVVVTESTIEVLSFDGNTQTFALFRKDERRGSILGNSLVIFKDNIFGFFTDGYGIFDGFQYKGVSADQDELFSYIDRHNSDRIRAFINPASGYWCVVNFNAKSASGSTMLLYYDFNNNAWFRILDTNISSMWLDDENVVVGGYEDIYTLDAGTGPPSPGAKLEITNTSFSEGDGRAALVQKTISSIYLLSGSTQNIECDASFYADENLISPRATAKFSLRGSSEVSFQDSIMDPAWNDALWDEDTSAWVGPRMVWQKIVDFDESLVFHSIRTSFTFPPSSVAEIAGIGYDIEVVPVQPGVP